MHEACMQQALTLTTELKSAPCSATCAVRSDGLASHPLVMVQDLTRGE